MNLIKDNNANSISYTVSTKNNYSILNNDLIDELKRIAFSTKKNVRFNLHNDKNESLHTMVIFQWKEQPFVIHKHNNNIEVCHIIEGEHCFNIYSKDGKNIIEQIYMSNIKNRLIRIDKEIFHLSIPVSEYVIFHEVKLGPFDPNDNVKIG